MIRDLEGNMRTQIPLMATIQTEKSYVEYNWNNQGAVVI